MVFKKIRKSHVDWRDFLCGTPASDYIFQKDAYEEQIENAVNFIKDADAVIIGAGAGASTAAGLEYGGKRFTDHFAEFIEKYGGHYMTDMYAAGFYPFPSELVPKCPVCGGNMTMHLRCDNYFVEDEPWHEAADRYADFLDRNQSKKVVLIELGVGFNTPIIIRFPFEKLVREHVTYRLIRLNMDEAVVPESFGSRAIGIGGDVAGAITDIGRLIG